MLSPAKNVMRQAKIHRRRRSEQRKALFMSKQQSKLRMSACSDFYAYL